MVCEELRRVLETTGIIQSIIRAALHIHDVTHSKNSRLTECLKTDINHSTLHTQLPHPAQCETSPVTQHELSPTLYMHDYVLHDARVKAKTTHTVHINMALYRAFLSRGYTSSNGRHSCRQENDTAAPSTAVSTVQFSVKGKLYLKFIGPCIILIA